MLGTLTHDIHGTPLPRVIASLHSAVIRYNERSMKILDNVPLGLYCTMRLGGKARHLVAVRSEAELLAALEWARTKKLPYLMIGSGANVIFSDKGYGGLIIVNDIRGRH